MEIKKFTNHFKNNNRKNKNRKKSFLPISHYRFIGSSLEKK